MPTNRLKNRIFDGNMRSTLQFLSLTILFLSSLGLSSQTYDYANPTKIISLPPILREISDITLINKNRVACVQDERGILFQYSLKKNLIVSQDSFYLDGDYEGVAKVKNDIFVLRGDGVIIEIRNAVKGERKVQLYQTDISAANNEGLCYDKLNNRLLIACKSRSLTNATNRDKRMIYAFDLASKKLLPDPVFEIDIPAIKKAVAQKYSLMITVADAIKFKPSAIAIHPISKKLYLLTASGYLLCVFNDGMFESVEMLNPSIFNKAEGICFQNNGDMLISNEGQTGTATLLYLKYKRDKK